MTVAYRPMRAEEAPAVLQLWSRTFGVPESYQAVRFASDPAAYAHTYVAVLPDGTIISTAHYLISQRRDSTGLVRRVGEIDSVATLEAFRRQGHAEQLLLRVLAALEREGCDWSLLVSTPLGRTLYERHGWRCYPEPWRRGTVSNVPSSVERYLVRLFDPVSEPHGWERLAAVDGDFNQRRPLTVVRDERYWRHYAAVRVSNWIDTEGLVIMAAFGAETPEALCGYAMTEFYPTAFQIRDLGVLHQEPAAVSALLNAVTREATRRGIPPNGRLYLPLEPSVDTALEGLFGTTLQYGQDQGHLMARSIGSAFSDAQLDALFSAPGAIVSGIDLF